MSEELIKRLREEAETIHGLMSFTGVYAALLDAAKALESRPAPVQVPSGWKLVPVEPTPAMLEAMQSSGWLPTCYSAMLAAAPSAPAAPSVDAEKVMRRIDSIITDCDMSEGRQTGGYLSAGDLRQIRALLTPANGGWQPIETAPKDGRQILAFRPAAPAYGDEQIVICRTTAAKNFAWDGGDNYTDRANTATHWQPLPPPPAIAGDNAADLARLTAELAESAEARLEQAKTIQRQQAKLAESREREGRMREALEKLQPLARRVLWMAFVWNDHNFTHPLDYAREEAKKAGLNCLDDAQEFLADLSKDMAFDFALKPQQAADNELPK